MFYIKHFLIMQMLMLSTILLLIILPTHCFSLSFTIRKIAYLKVKEDIFIKELLSLGQTLTLNCCISAGHPNSHTVLKSYGLLFQFECIISHSWNLNLPPQFKQYSWCELRFRKSMNSNEKIWQILPMIPKYLKHFHVWFF